MTPYFCHRTWPSRHGGVGLCTLRFGHRGDRCLDTEHNVSCPTADTNQSVWDRIMARLGQVS